MESTTQEARRHFPDGRPVTFRILEIDEAGRFTCEIELELGDGTLESLRYMPLRKSGDLEADFRTFQDGFIFEFGGLKGRSVTEVLAEAALEEEEGDVWPDFWVPLFD